MKSWGGHFKNQFLSITTIPRGMIIIKYDVILDQSQRKYLYDYWEIL